MPELPVEFEGFRPEAVQFLADLVEHNDREWFNPRKREYERLLKAPFEALVVAMASRFEERGLPLQADVKRSLFRIYRDTRFSKDKSPYKRHLGASFPWVDPSSGVAVADERAHGNGAYFHFAPGDMHVGGGMWQPDKARLDAFRRLIVEHPERVSEAIEAPEFVATFGTVTSHDRLKRVPPGYPADHPHAELLTFRDVIFGRPLADSEVLSPSLPDTLVEAYVAAMPVLRLLATLRP